MKENLSSQPEKFFCTYCKKQIEEAEQQSKGYHTQCYEAVMTFPRNQLPQGSDTVEALEAIEDTAQVTSIDLTGQHLLVVPDIIFEFPNLETLNLSYNNLEDINDILYPPEFSKLKILNASHNSISLFFDEDEFDADEFSLLHLEELHLAHNDGIYYVPDWINKLTALKVLTLDHCPIEDYPEAIATKIQK